MRDKLRCSGEEGSFVKGLFEGLIGSRTGLSSGGRLRIQSIPIKWNKMAEKKLSTTLKKLPNLSQN